jgi:3-phosphoshikimate 1-carboxyvinyltransferase
VKRAGGPWTALSNGQYGRLFQALQSTPMGEVHGTEARGSGPVRTRGLTPGMRLSGELRPPGSKSMAIRTFLAAGLAQGRTRIEGVPPGDDVRACLGVIESCGLELQEEEPGCVEIEGRSPAQGQMLQPVRALDCGESGTLARLVTSLLALCGEPGREARVEVRGSLLRRFSEPLLETLASAGVGLEGGSSAGSWPLVLQPAMPGETLMLQGPVSSQELSGLLMALAAHAAGPRGRSVLVMGGLPSEPYARMTAGVLEQFGARVSQEGSEWRVVGPLTAPSDLLAIETDASSAAVALAAGCLSGGEVRVPGFSESSWQGDLRIVEHLQAFGCEVERERGQLRAWGGPTRTAVLDLSGEPDLAPVLVAVAGAFALRGGEGRTCLTGLETLNGKECRRLEVLAGGLRTLGVAVEESETRINIAPGPGRFDDQAAMVLDPHGDHRMAFAFALLGLVRGNLEVADPACVAKSWPSFWEDCNAAGC